MRSTKILEILHFKALEGASCKSRTVRNTLSQSGEIQLTKFEKYCITGTMKEAEEEEKEEG